jgi:hypothetical protein
MVVTASTPIVAMAFTYMVASATTITGKLHQQRKSKTSLFLIKCIQEIKLMVQVVGRQTLMYLVHEPRAFSEHVTHMVAVTTYESGVVVHSSNIRRAINNIKTIIKSRVKCYLHPFSTYTLSETFTICPSSEISSNSKS